MSLNLESACTEIMISFIPVSPSAWMYGKAIVLYRRPNTILIEAVSRWFPNSDERRVELFTIS